MFFSLIRELGILCNNTINSSVVIFVGPNHLKVFCDCCNEIMRFVGSAQYDDKASRIDQSIWSVIDGLADCIDHRVSSNQVHINKLKHFHFVQM